MRWLRVGTRAVLVEVDTNEEVLALHSTLRAGAGTITPVAEVVPGARTVLFDGVDDIAALRASVETLTSKVDDITQSTADKVVEVPVRYDGADLTAVARRWGMTAAEAAATHAGASYVVAFCGFVPGFAYCVGLPRDLHLPRLPTPRVRVPAGSVGLAGEFTGVYPTSSPGGWRLLGRTDLRLWDEDAEPPATLAPGTRVRFVEVGP